MHKDIEEHERLERQERLNLLERVHDDDNIEEYSDNQQPVEWPESVYHDEYIGWY